MGDFDGPWQPQAPSDGTVADVSLKEWIGQALGAASMCWADVRAAGEFDSVRCSWIYEGLAAHLEAMLDAAVKAAAAGAASVTMTGLRPVMRVPAPASLGGPATAEPPGE